MRSRSNPLGAESWVDLSHPRHGSAPTGSRFTEEEYLTLDSEGGRLIELVDWKLEELPMPTLEHQLIADYLLDRFKEFIAPRKLGKMLFAPLPVHLRAGLYREPDLIFLSQNRLGAGTKYPEGADLVVEIVSPDAKSQKRDYEEKRRDYAGAMIPEYWIVDPEEKSISVLVLEGRQYREHGVFRAGESATSVLLPGLAMAVAEVFRAGV